MTYAAMISGRTVAERNVDRRDTLQALADLPDLEWQLLLRVIQPLNQFLGHRVMPDQRPNERLDAAIDAELARLRQL
jgi:hypothetical protein